MLDFGHIPTDTGATDVQFFIGTAQAVGTDWQTWIKPRGKTMIDIYLAGKGGNGGTGVIGAAGGGGGGGGSGAQTRLTMPLALIPDVLFLNLIGQGSATGVASVISVVPPISGTTIVAQNTLAIAGGGGAGGNAATTTGGTAGSAGAAGNAATMLLGFGWGSSIVGSLGTVGGSGLTTGTVGLPLTLPVTGLLLTGGTGGGACPTTVGAGTAGGLMTGLGFVPTIAGGVGGTGTTPPTHGNGGYQPMNKLGYRLGGTGGGASGSNSSGAGLFPGSGAGGALGCGGGGSGGGFTGSTPGVVGLGGASFCIITCW